MTVTADAPVPFFTDTRSLAEKLGSNVREWRPHEPEHDCPSEIYGLVIDRGEYFSKFDKQHDTAQLLTAENVVWSVIAFHGYLQSEFTRKKPLVGDFIAVAFKGTKPARKQGESDAYVYQMEVERNPTPTDPAETSEPPGGDNTGQLADDADLPF